MGGASTVRWIAYRQHTSAIQRPADVFLCVLPIWVCRSEVSLYSSYVLERLTDLASLFRNDVRSTVQSRRRAHH